MMEYSSLRTGIADNIADSTPLLPYNNGLKPFLSKRIVAIIAGTIALLGTCLLIFRTTDYYGGQVFTHMNGKFYPSLSSLSCHSRFSFSSCCIDIFSKLDVSLVTNALEQIVSFDGDIGSCEVFAIYGSNKVFFDGDRSSIPIGSVGTSSPSNKITAKTGTVEQVLATGTKEAGTASAKACDKDRQAIISSGLQAACTFRGISQLAGLVLAPGVYCSKTFQIGERETSVPTVYLDGSGYKDPKWVFVAETTFNANINAKIVISGGGKSSNVFWIAGENVNIGAHAQIEGTILATSGIILGTGSIVFGRAIAGTDVTCISHCVASAYTGPASSGTFQMCYPYIHY
jgi:hypothetical protein